MNLIKFLFPRKCVMCDRAVAEGGNPGGFCPKCAAKLKPVRGAVCLTCGRPVEKQREYCTDCGENRHEFKSGRFSFRYSDIADSVYRFKYDKHPEYARTYAEVLYKELKPGIESLGAEALIPVPIHKKRFLKRGFNQSALLAKELSKLSGIPLYENYVVRNKNTLPQKNFDRKERQINVKNSFICTENSVKLSNAILIDDIYTTGSTLDSVTGVLKARGIRNVYFITITAAGT